MDWQGQTMQGNQQVDPMTGLRMRRPPWPPIYRKQPVRLQWPAAAQAQAHSVPVGASTGSAPATVDLAGLLQQWANLQQQQSQLLQQLQSMLKGSRP
ncbi:MAG: hypothetical protein IMW99_02680 [Firmicutes bacterium]|nr:hypothetical protein [Bacillota bacterium]